MHDIPKATQDCLTMKALLQKYDMDLQDGKNCFIHLDDIEKNVNKSWRSVAATIKKNPTKKYLLFSLFAGHGMIVRNSQVLLTNEFDKARKYYKFM